jgi:hypothetical protein
MSAKIIRRLLQPGMIADEVQSNRQKISSTKFLTSAMKRRASQFRIHRFFPLFEMNLKLKELTAMNQKYSLVLFRGE